MSCSRMISPCLHDPEALVGFASRCPDHDYCDRAGGSAGGAYIVDWNDYKSTFEAHAAKMLGRAVRVEGEVDLTICRFPRCG